MELREHPELTGYYISPYGDVYSNLRGSMKQKKPSLHSCGYYTTSISHPTKGHIGAYYVHHLVAETYLGDRPDSLVIDHIDRDKTNNSVSNLRYVTQQVNLLNRGIPKPTGRFIVEAPPLHNNTWWL